VDLPAGRDALIERLSQQFPHERSGIKKYVSLVATVGEEIQLVPKMNGFWDNITIPYRTRHMGKYGLFSLKRVIDWHLKDPLLKAALNIQCGDHGLPPQRASFAVHCTIMDHYFHGGFYPMGGGAGIVKAFTKQVKKHGGEIRVKQRVKRIIVNGHQASGVELEDGSRIMASTILSNADIMMTYSKLVGTDHLSKSFRKKLDKTRFSVTSLMLFLTLDLDVKKAGLDSGNIWFLKSPDLDQTFAKMTASDILKGDEFDALFISCTTLKDPASFNGRYHNLEVVTYIGYESFHEFNQANDYHGDAYAGFKKRITEKIMNSVERIIPGARDHVVQMELGTPKTNQFYLETTDGNVYGTEKTLSQVGPFSFQHKTEIRNLYVCGASTLSHGVSGATMSGVNAAAQILGCKIDDLLKTEGADPVRIYEAEDESSWPAFVVQKRADRMRTFKEVSSF
jgi:phytoene dehydrogenase-like protein